MCSDLETSLAKIRPQSEKEELAEKWNELSTYNLGKLFAQILYFDVNPSSNKSHM